MPLLILTVPSRQRQPRPSSEIPAEVHQQIETVASIRARSERDLSRHQRAIESFTARLGHPRTLYILLALVACWVTWNVALRLGGHTPPDPPPFYWLQGFLSLYAALVTTLVLTTQNRQTRHTEHRAYLELQVNLLAEQKAAKIIQLLEELRRDMPAVRDRVDEEAEKLKRAVNPKAVFSALQETLDAAPDLERDSRNP